MIKIGLIGSENSHSLAYARLLNFKDSPNHVRGARIVAIWGEPGLDDRTKQVAEDGAIPEIVAKPADLVGKVDGAICTCRDGAVHARYSLPVIKAGVPTFVDKPFATSLTDARAMIRAAEKAKAPITSFSSIRLGTDVANFIKKARKADVSAGVSTGPADIDSEYSGLIFYGIHAVETMVDVFGTDVKSVFATVTASRNVAAVVQFKSDKHCCLNFMKTTRVWDLALYTDKEVLRHPLGSSDGYAKGLKLVLKMVKTGKPPIPYDWLQVPVKVFVAINKSLETGKEVKV